MARENSRLLSLAYSYEYIGATVNANSMQPCMCGCGCCCYFSLDLYQRAYEFAWRPGNCSPFSKVNACAAVCSNATQFNRKTFGRFSSTFSRLNHLLSMTSAFTISSHAAIYHTFLIYIFARVMGKRWNWPFWYYLCYCITISTQLPCVCVCLCASYSFF